MDRPGISVVIPAYNSARYLPDAIRSALQQTHAPAEIIVIDDGSSDNTPEVVRGFQNQIRFVRQENAGPSGARNRGVREARSEWIAFLDADDVWFPDKLATQLKLLESIQGPVLLCSAATPFTDAPPAPEPGSAAGTSEVLSPERLLRRNRVATSTVLVPREAILSAGGFDGRYRGPEDFALWLKLAMNGLPIHYQPRSLAGYRLVPGSLSQQAIRMRDQELQIVSEFGRGLPWTVQAEAAASVHFRAALSHAEAGNRRDALQEVLRSIAAWCLGLSEYARRTPLVRLRLLKRILLRRR